MGGRARSEGELEQLAEQIRYHEAAYRAGVPPRFTDCGVR